MAEEKTEKKTTEEPEAPEVKKDLAEEVDVNSKPECEWKSPDMIQQDRGAGWYVILIVGAVVLSVLMATQGLWTGLALIVVAALVLAIGSRLKPRVITCAVYAQGLVIDDRVYKFGEFKSFWVNLAVLPKIKLQRIGQFAGTIDLPLLNADLDLVRSILVKHIPEEEDKGEDLVDRVNRVIKF